MSISIEEVLKNNDLIDAFMKENSKLVKKIINDKFKATREIPYEDLFQAGMLGLYMAVQRYDISKGNRFSTFAYFYINGYIRQLLRSDFKGGLKTSVKINEKLNKIKHLLGCGLSIEEIKEQVKITPEMEDVLYSSYFMDNVMYTNDGEELSMFDFAKNKLGNPSDKINQIDFDYKMELIKDIISTEAYTICYSIAIEGMTYVDMTKKYHLSINQIRNALNKVKKYYFLVEDCYNGLITLDEAKQKLFNLSRPGVSIVRKKEEKKIERKEKIKMPKRTLTNREKISHDEAVKRLYAWALNNPGKYINQNSLGNVIIRDCNFSDVKADTILILRKNGYNVEQVANSYKLINNESVIDDDKDIELIKDVACEKEIEEESKTNVKYDDIKELLDTIVNIFQKKYEELDSGTSCFKLENETLDCNNIENIYQILKSMVQIAHLNNKTLKLNLQLIEK